MTGELDVLREMCERLESLEIDYMLTGSMAMNYYAVPRMTRDIDVVIALPAPRVASLVDSFSPDYMIVKEAVEQAVATEFMFNVIHQESVIKIDFICRKNEPYRQKEFKRRRQVDIDGFQTWIVTREDLILSKLVWMKDSLSQMQSDDIKNLLGNPDVDQPYLDHWASKLGVASLLEELTSP